jgi:hypothetical protein
MASPPVFPLIFIFLSSAGFSLCAFEFESWPLEHTSKPHRLKPVLRDRCVHPGRFNFTCPQRAAVIGCGHCGGLSLLSDTQKEASDGIL